MSAEDIYPNFKKLDLSPSKKKKWRCDNFDCVNNGEHYLPEGVCDKCLCPNRIIEQIKAKDL